MNKHEKNCVGYIEIGGIPHTVSDCGTVDKLPENEREIYASTPIIPVNYAKIKNIVYLDTYPTVENACNNCKSIYGKMTVEKNKVYIVCCICQTVFECNEI
jgi:hypothetical protein